MNDGTLDAAPAAAGVAPLWRQPDLRLFIGARMAIVFAMQMQHVAIGWSLYVLTGDPLSLGLAGLIEFLPSLLLMLVTGAAADRFDRRKLAAASAAILCVASLALMGVILGPAPDLWLIYAILLVIGAARAFALPALGALMPNIVAPADFSRALATTASCLQAAMIAGPALGGLLTAVSGLALFSAAAALSAAAAAMILRIRPRQADEGAAGPAPPERGLKAALGGLAYLRSNRLLFGAITLDLFAVLFGGVTALLPIFSRDIFAAGPGGLGLLRACPALGAVLVGLVLARFPLRGRVGAILLWSVAGYGAATIVFAISRSFALAAAAMIALGAFDVASMVIRMSLVQLGTPDAMRGRVNAVAYVFIGASNQLGDFESSLVASLAGVRAAAFLGGAAALVVVAVCAWRFPELRRADRLA